MDVAGALGLTAIFPGVIGMILTIWALVWFNECAPLDMGDRVFFRRLIIPGTILLGVAILMWITAIWLGYAQAAGIR